jgi:hypothetical protein
MEMKDLLGKALEIVNEVRDYNTFKWAYDRNNSKTRERDKKRKQNETSSKPANHNK